MSPSELKEARRKLGLSQSAFAKLGKNVCGYPIAANGRTVRRWESGEREIPSPVQIIVWLMLCSATVRDLMLGSGHKPPAPWP